MSSRRLMRSAAVVLGLGMMSMAEVNAVPATALHEKEELTVGQLLQMESKAWQSGMQDSDKGRKGLSPTLVGIWGVGNALTARIVHEGRTVDFQQGRTHALEPFHHRYLLLAIMPPCVRFKTSGKVFNVCAKGLGAMPLGERWIAMTPAAGTVRQ